MKIYIHFMAFAVFLCCTACANKNVTVEETNQLADTETKTAGSYDINSTVTSICTCIEESVEKSSANVKKTSLNNASLTKYKTNCEKKAYAEYGLPTTAPLKMELQNALRKECGQLLSETSSSTNTLTKKSLNKKDMKSGKEEPIRPNLKITPRPIEKE